MSEVRQIDFSENYQVSALNKQYTSELVSVLLWYTLWKCSSFSVLTFK